MIRPAKTVRIGFLALLLSACVSLYGQTQSKAVPKTGSVRGIVTDKKGDRPLAGAIVAVTGDTLSAVTDSGGAFRIGGVRTGYNTLYVTADGFHSALTESFLVTASAEAVVDVALDSLMVRMEDVVVTASPFTPTAESPVSMRRIGTEEIEMTPGANRDISKVAQSAPGVIATPMQRNDILVRGGGANENRYYLDGIEIPVLNHFAVQGGSGGNASLVNTDLLRTVNFHTGAFPAALGSGLSSVMDMRMKNGNSERFHSKLTLGASDVGLSIDTPVSADGRTTLLASYRRSYLQMLFSVLGLPFLPTYNDYQLKLSSKIGPRDEIYLLGIGSTDYNRLNNGLKDPDDGQRYILGYLPENRQASYAVGIGYRHSLRRGQLRVVLSRDGFYNRLYKYEDNDRAKSRTMDYDMRQSNNRLRAEIELRDVAGFRFTGGVGGGSGSYRSTTSRPLYDGSGEHVAERYSGQFTMGRYELFATLSRRFFSERLSLLVGIRADGSSYSRETANPLRQLSPRLNVSYRLSEKWAVSASAARYYQEPPYTTLGYRDSLGTAVNKETGLRYMGADHFIAGVEYSPQGTSRLALEGFYKRYFHYPVSLIDSLPLSTSDLADYTIGDVPARSTGRGQAYGIELSYRNTDLYNTVVNFSYTFFRARFNRPDGMLAPSRLFIASDRDVRHILNVSAIHKFGRNWTLGAKWYFMGGFPYSPWDAELSSRIDAWDARRRPYADYALYNTRRLRPYHQLDARVDKVWYFSKWRLGFYFDIQNLYNYKARGQDILMPETDASGQYVPDPSRPGHYKMRSVGKEIGGTVLPTLGITIEL